MWLALIPYTLPQGLVWLGMIALGAVFLLRGVIGYMPPFRARFSAQPFATLDKRFYSPLCLVIGAAYFLLLRLPLLGL
ncbi:MAG: DUF3995 domain-containing protein [Rhizobiaceae bacterium]